MSWMLKIENVSKMYRLGMIDSSTIQDDLKAFYYKLRGKENPFLKIGEENKRDTEGGDYVWALKNINLEIEKGEILGIVGKNGAGKSTLLKLLSKVTKPSQGTIRSRGRIASLLEVGTGFHSELSGRDNIYLNGAILGMSKREITSKLDEIIDFSGCGRYIDTPVKRYSSGMYVRLAFAVAAHLDPEILVVDEVLAVGDVEFQKKAIGKMKHISREGGRTVLFVSHNLKSIKSLCSKAILLKNGMLDFYGNCSDTIDKYLETDLKENNFLDKEIGNKNFKFNFIGLKSQNKTYQNPIIRIDQTELVLEYENLSDFKKIHFTIKLKGVDDNIFLTTISPENFISERKGKVKMQLPKGYFNEGDFLLDIYVIRDKSISILGFENIIGFSVIAEEINIGEYSGTEKGYSRQAMTWIKEY